ncbi:hypothetical protein BJ912DRAFT_642851 [Pholiota molesta]|nr:hypothetical protein BJ912DRAFT_642851 [Pholiota molesta]
MRHGFRAWEIMHAAVQTICLPAAAVVVPLSRHVSAPYGSSSNLTSLSPTRIPWPSFRVTCHTCPCSYCRWNRR